VRILQVNCLGEFQPRHRAHSIARALQVGVALFETVSTEVLRQWRPAMGTRKYHVEALSRKGALRLCLSNKGTDECQQPRLPSVVKRGTEVPDVRLGAQSGLERDPRWRHTTRPTLVRSGSSANKNSCLPFAGSKRANTKVRVRLSGRRVGSCLGSMMFQGCRAISQVYKMRKGVLVRVSCVIADFANSNVLPGPPGQAIWTSGIAPAAALAHLAGAQNVQGKAK
jgi:hypothetical protein